MRQTFRYPVASGILVVLLAATPAMATTCTIPNAIANGPVADASKVMDDIDAMANCVDAVDNAAVKPDGAPANGSIAVFTAPRTISSSNLTGDVTTSNGAAISLSATGVVAGTYSNPNIIVDAKGRITAASCGSGGGTDTAWWFPRPLPRLLRWVAEVSR